MSTTVIYNNSTIGTLDNQTKKLDTAGTWLVDDVTLVDQSSGGEVLVVDTPDSHGGTIREITAQNVVSLQGQKQVTLTSNPQTISPDTGYDGFASVIVSTNNNYDMDITPYDVIYVDYDGNPVYWYTKANFLALSAHPANPSHTGLTAQGWNWTLADAKTYVTNYGKLIIGQNYVTSDGKTHIYIDIPDGITNQTFALYAKASAANSLTVDWGDGNTSTHGTGNSVSHTYSNSGAYEITLTPASNATYYLGYNGANNCIFGTNNSEGRAARSYVTKVHIGSSVTAIYRQCFQECRNLEVLSIPQSTTSIDPGSSGNVFGNCDSLRGLVLPSGFAKIPYLFIPSTRALKFVSFPKSVTQIASNAFGTQANNLNMLRALTLPEITDVSGQVLNVSNAEWFIMPGTYTSLSGKTITTVWRLKEFTIPASVTSITDSFVCRVKTYHVLATTPPTLSASNIFPIWSGLVIYVPYSADHSILEAYKNDTNWSAYESYLQEEPQS